MRKSVIVTGATSGIGYALCIMLAHDHSWDLGIIGRDKEKVDKTLQLLSEIDPEGRHKGFIADFSSLDSLQNLAVILRNSYSNGIDVFVSNAGRFSSKKSVTMDGFEETFMVNHLAPVFLAHSLLDWIKEKWLQVSSDAHKIANLDINDPQGINKYRAAIAYANSKLLNIYLTQWIVEKHANVFAAAIHPGGVQTNFAKGSSGLTGLIFHGPLKWMLRKPEKGAETLYFLVHANGQNLPNGEYWFDKNVKITSDLAKDSSSMQYWMDYCLLLLKQ